MSTMTPDDYQLLGVNRDATADEIRSAYEHLAAQYEIIQDKTPESEARFIEIGNAYQALSDPDRRAIYDEALRAQSPLPAGETSAPVAAPFLVPWKVGDVVLGLVLLLALQIGVGLVVAVGLLIMMMMQGGRSVGATDILLFVALQVGEALMFVVAWSLSVLKYRAGWASLGFRIPASVPWAMIGTAGAVVAMFLVGAIYSVVVSGLQAHSLEPGPTIPSYLVNTPWSVAAFVVLAVLVAPFAEETFFRGFVFGGLSKKLGFWWGAIISSALFAVAHASLAALVPIFFVGLLLSTVYKRTGSIWFSMLAHGLYNGLAVLVFLLNLPY